MKKKIAGRLAEIVRDSRKTLKDYSEMVANLEDTIATEERYEDRQELRENIAFSEGEIDALERAVAAIKSGLSMEEFRVLTESELRSTVEEMREFAGYTGPSAGWRSYITSGNVPGLYDDDLELYLTLASMIGGIDELIRLNKKYTVGLDPDLVISAKEHATLNRE